MKKLIVFDLDGTLAESKSSNDALGFLRIVDLDGHHARLFDRIIIPAREQRIAGKKHFLQLKAGRSHDEQL